MIKIQVSACRVGPVLGLSVVSMAELQIAARCIRRCTEVSQIHFVVSAAKCFFIAVATTDTICTIKK
jgi:hypothetical protein